MDKGAMYYTLALFATYFLPALTNLEVKYLGCKNAPTNTRTYSNCTVNGNRNTATCRCEGCTDTVNVTLICLASQWMPKKLQHIKCLECQSAKCWSNIEISNLACPENNETGVQDFEIGYVKLCHCRSNCMQVVLNCEKYGAARKWIYNSSICKADSTHVNNVKLQGFDEHLLVSYTLQTMSFKCESGYKLLGTNQSACLVGKFETQPPTCEPISESCATRYTRRMGNLMIAFGAFMIFLSFVILLCRDCKPQEQHQRMTLRVPTSTITHKNTKYSKLG